MFRYKSERGLEKDFKAHKATSALCPPIIDKINREIFPKEHRDILEEDTREQYHIIIFESQILFIELKIGIHFSEQVFEHIHDESISYDFVKDTFGHLVFF